MTTEKNFIGLNQEQSQSVARELNQLLAHYQVFYMNTRGYHWNVKGPQFFELHTKFEEIYTDLQTKIDEIAERILTLGFMPDHSFTTYLEASSIKEDTQVTDGAACVKGLVDGFTTLLEKQRSILDSSADAGDEGTNALMGDYIREQEKLMWMLNAYLQ
ncbi:DNA starvation/stationary phase protection protein [Vibrio sp. AK197]|uniref:Dps family protein n=1 Tax=Vibrio olivae TaxID=1243002 RepID=A0ABV5HIA4_9VIBR